MRENSNITWWKVLLSVIGPPVLASGVLILYTGFLVVFNFLWNALGISQPEGYVYTTAIATALLFLLYWAHRSSSYARILAALPISSAVLLALLAISAYGIAAIPAMRFVSIGLVGGLWIYLGSLIWRTLADV